MDLSKIFYQSDIKEHAKKKSMWGGSFDPNMHSEYIERDGKFVMEDILYADSLYKCFDEVIVNVVDVHVKNKKQTNRCIVTFSPDGYISIFNNGQGIPIGMVPNLQGELVYVPQLVSTEFLAGSNNEDDAERITGGVNGIGLSMVNNNSAYFSLETVDLTRKKHYFQECKNRLTEICDPVVTTLSKIPAKNIHKRGGTTIRFLPDYAIYNTDIKTQYDTLNDLFRSRIFQITAHTGMNITYNDEPVPSTKMTSFGSMFMDSCVCLKISHEKYPWDVCIGLSSGDAFKSLSIINGVHVKTGSHISYIRDQIINAIKPKAERLLKKYKDYKKSLLQNNLFVIISGNIPNPSFDSQTKTNISGPMSKYKEYKMTAPFINKVWKLVETRLLEQLTKPTAVKKVNVSGIAKYKKAKNAGKRGCVLLICEGDSAESMTRTALTNRQVTIGYDYYGTFNIGGVPMNSRTKSTIHITGDKKIMVCQKQLLNNERLTSLSKVLNLRYDLDYKDDSEFNTLSYDQVVATVDQDLDGIGQIFGLLLSHFERFWPSLVKRGYVKYLATPIIRAFPKKSNTVKSFYTDAEYKQWSEDQQLKDWVIKYYKGLATHSDAEAVHMFQQYNKSLYTIIHDEKASSMLDIYYGCDPDKRKTELIGEYVNTDPVDMSIACTDQLRTHTKEFQLDNIKRKLPNVYDGLNPSRRKVLCASRKRFLSNNAEVKVFQLAGYVAEHMNYHHGSASLEKTIINMAQDFIGANNLPLLLPMSQFGSRTMGGKDYGAPRYIKTKLNKELVSALFRVEDDEILAYTYDEGERNEPIHYIPIAPLILLESLEIPATGWKYTGYARDWKSVYSNIVCRLNGGLDIKTMPFWKNGWTGTLKEVDGHIYSEGVSTVIGNSGYVRITELPYRVWTNDFVEKIQDCDDNSSKNQVDITVKTEPNLMKRMTKFLNVLGDNDRVLECKTYKSIFNIWYDMRYKTYVKRHARECVLRRLRLVYYNLVVRFVEDHKKYDFSVLDEKKAIVLFEQDNYPIINKQVLDSPGLIPTEQIEERVYGTGASYNYLFSIGPRQRMKSARDTRAEKIKQLNMKPMSIKNTWLKELDELNSVIMKGTTQGWLYAERKMRY